jgi:HK97 family phage prohead protease
MPIDTVVPADELSPEVRARMAKAELLRGREVRRHAEASMEVRTDGDTLTFRGLASSTESPYDMGWYSETIARGAFTKTLSERPDVVLLLNHEGLPLAATRNGSLTLEQTSRGLEFTATADAADPDAARVATKVSSGLLQECSFAFRPTRQTWNEDYTERTINEVSLDRGDVSIVTFGANPNTAVSLRSALAEAAELDDEALAELRQDPAIITVIRRLTTVPSVLDSELQETAPTVEIQQSEGVASTRDLDHYRARAFALALRK